MPAGPPPIDYEPIRPQPLRLALSSCIFGVSSIPLMAIGFLGAIPALAAVVTGAVALVQLNKNPRFFGRARALVGIITGSIALLLGGLCAASIWGPSHL